MVRKIVSFLLVLAILLPTVSGVLGTSMQGREETVKSYTGKLNDSTDLLFEFDNREKDQTRYQGASYGGFNYDQEANGYWATAYNGSSTAYTIVNSGGTLRVKVTDGKDSGGTYGPWIKITNTHGKLPSYNANSYDLYPLNFDPSGVETVNIRFKLVGCSVPTGKTPEIIFEYYYLSGGSYGYGNDMKAIYTFHDGEYMTVSFPVSSKLKNADELKGFGFRFRNIKSSNGTIYIDHIYMGAASSFVMKSHEDKTFLSQSVTPITSGVTQSRIFLKNKTDNTQIAGVMATVSPSAKVTFKASYASYYTKGSTPESRKTAGLSMPFSRMVATDHAAAYEAATGDKVLMVTNGNFFNTETFQPRGTLVLESNIIQTYSVHYGAPYFAVLKDGSFAMRPFGYPLTDVKEAVSGYQWLVRDGELITTNDDETLAPRTAIGLKEDGTVVWLAIDGRQEPYSSGLTIHEMGEIMYAAGCVNAMNMDGGGSTVMASRYNSTGDLIVQNSPSDSGGQRLLPTCLLMVAEACDHKLTGQGYTLYPDGTHAQTCASCSEEIRVGHIYDDKGLCVCGDARHFGDGLFFDFSDTDEDKYRYTDPNYGYRNFDMTSDGSWGRGYWATGYTDTTSDFAIDNQAGTLTVAVGQGYSGASGSEVYGPWMKLTSAYGKAPTATDSRFGALSYDPSEIDYVEICFKVEGCVVPEGKTPDVYFEYYYQKDGVYGAASDMCATYTYVAGEYITLRIPATEALRSAQELQAFGFRFRNVMGNASGKVTVDYIYIGSDGIKEPQLEENFKLGHTLNLASDISVNFAVPVTALEGFDMDTVYARCRYYDYVGNDLGEEKVITLKPVLNGSYYYFTLEGLTAIHMTNELTTVLYGTKDGQIYYSPTDTYSIATYAYSQLGKVSMPQSLKTLCADLLRYGSAVQTLKGYRTDCLADRELTEEQMAYLSDIGSLTFGSLNEEGTELESPTVLWKGKSLDLQSKVGIKYIVDLTNYKGEISALSLKVSYTDLGGQERTETVEEIETYKEADSLYAFSYYGLLAAELRTPVTVQVMEGDTPVSNTLQYRADTYGNGKNGQLLQVCKALFAYSDSALAYFQ